MIVAGTVLGLLLERLAFRPLAGRPDEHFAGLISSVAFGGMLIALLRARYGSEQRTFPEGAFPATVFHLAGVSVSFTQVTILVLALGLMLALARIVARRVPAVPCERWPRTPAPHVCSGSTWSG